MGDSVGAVVVGDRDGDTVVEFVVGAGDTVVEFVVGAGDTVGGADTGDAVEFVASVAFVRVL